jgi:hypothetical protein
MYTSSHCYLKACGSSTSPEEFMRLAVSGSETIRARVAENASAPLGALKSLIEDDSPRVRAAVTYNPGVPELLLSILAQDSHPDVRFAIAENPHIPAALLNKLSEDENPYVCHRAKKTMTAIEGSKNIQQEIRFDGPNDQATRRIRRQ